MKKRFVAFLLVLIMVLGMLPVSAMASDSTPGGVATYAATPEVKIIRSTLDGHWVNFGTVTNAFQGINPSATYTQVLGEQDNYQFLPVSGDNVAYYSPVAYYVPRTGSVTVSKEGIIDDLSFSMEPYYNTNYGFYGSPCLQFNFKAIAPGTTTVTVTYYYNFNVETGAIGAKSWYVSTATFTITVRDEQIQAPNGPSDSDLDNFNNNYRDNGGTYRNDAVHMRCVDNNSHTRFFNSVRDVSGAYTLSNVVANDGSYGVSAINYPWICTMTLDANKYLDEYNSQLATSLGTHYLENNESATKTVMWYYRAGLNKWQYQTSDAPVFIKITHNKPATEETYTLNFDGNGKGVTNVPDTMTYTGTETSHDFDVPSGDANTPKRDGYAFDGWAEKPDAVVGKYSADKTTVITVKRESNPMTVYAIWMPVYVLNYDANGGKGGPSSWTYKATRPTSDNVTASISKDTPTKEGYTFKGWSNEKNGDVVYQPGEKITIQHKDSPKTIYAVWEENTPPTPDEPNAPTYDEYKHTTVRTQCITSDVVHNGSDNAIAEGLENYGRSGTNYTIGTEVKQGTLDGKERYYVEGEIKNVAPFVRTFNSQYPGHAEASGHKLTFKLWYYPEYIGSTEPGVHVWQANTVPTIYVKCPPVPTADNIALKVKVECVSGVGHEFEVTQGLLSDSFELVDGLDANGWQKVKIYSAKYVAKYATTTRVAHTADANNEYKITTVQWNPTTEKWTTTIDSDTVTFNVTCETTSDEPTLANTDLNLIVKCVTNNAAHGEQSIRLKEGTFKRIGAIRDLGALKACEIEVATAQYVAEFDAGRVGTHTAADKIKVELYLKKNDSTAKWTNNKSATDNVIEVTCETTQEPDAPTDDTLKDLTIANVFCNVDEASEPNYSGKKHGSTSFEYKKGTLVTNPAITVENGMCTVQLNVAPYVQAYNDVNTAAVHSRKSADPDTVPVTLKYNGTAWEVAKINDVAQLAQIPVYCNLIPEPEHDAFAGDVILINCDTDQTHNKTLAYSNGEYEIIWTPGSSRCTVRFTVSTYVGYYTSHGHANHTAVTATEYVEKGYTYVNNKWKPDDTPQPVIHVKCTEQPIYVYFRPINSNLSPLSNSLTLADETLNRLGLKYNNGNKDWFTYGKLMSASTDMDEVEEALATTAFTPHADNKDFAYGDLISWAGELEWVNMGYHLGYDGETADAYHLNGDLKFYWVKYDTNAGADSSKVTGTPENYYDGGIQDYYLLGEKIDEMPTLSRPGYTFLGWKVKLDRDVSALSLPEIDGETTGTVDVEGGKPYEFTQYGNITFVAQWEKQYEVVYHANGGYLTSNKDKDQSSSFAFVGESLTLKNSTTFTRDHYDFLGWATTADAAAKEYDGSQKLDGGYPGAEPGGKYHLYAVWAPKQYTIIIDACYGENHLGWIKNTTGTINDKLSDVVLAALEKGNTLRNYEAAHKELEGYTVDLTQFYERDKKTPFAADLKVDGTVTYVYVKWNVIPHRIYAYTRLNSAYVQLTSDELGKFVKLNDATLARLGIGSYNTCNFISFGEFSFDAMPLTEDYYMASEKDPEVDAAVAAMKAALPDKADAAENIDWTVLYNVEESGMEPGYPTDDEDGYQMSSTLYLATVMFSDGAEGDKVENMPTVNYPVDDAIKIYDFYFSGDEITLPDNVPTRTGYTFKGWKAAVIPADDDDEEGGAVCYADELVQPGTKYTLKEGGVNFTAQWDANKYTVKFEKNSSNAAGTMADQSFTYDEAAKALRKNAFSRVGYTFNGWNTKKDGSDTAYTDEALVRNLTAEANGAVTLYAQWNINLYPFVFDSQDGSAVPTQTVAHGSTATKPADPTRSGYWFVGWYTDTTFTKLYDFSTPVTGPTTVYAGWTMIVLPSTITKKTPKLNTYDHFAYVQGYPDGTVKPEGNITRAETAAILFRLMDNSSRKTYLSTKSGFRDVTAGSWYNTYVATLNNAGVITDSANGYFRPNEAITRAELAAMLASFTEKTRAANYFDDVSANHWAAKAIAICAKLGWITGYPDGSFRPDRNVTRAELMAMINRATGRAPKSADAFLPGMKTWSDNTADKWYYLDVQEATNSHSYAVSPTELWTALTAAPDWSRYE